MVTTAICGKAFCEKRVLTHPQLVYAAQQQLQQQLQQQPAAASTDADKTADVAINLLAFITYKFSRFI